MKNAPPENCLIGKVIAHNHIVHKQSVISILQKAWKKHSHVTIIPWKNNFFKIAFEDKSDIPKVLQESPWCVMGFYLALLPWDSNKTLQEMEFDKGEFWIQVHDLPLGLLTSEYAMTIAESLGTLVDLDCIGEDGSQSWISLRYERLSDFCYRCGCLGHCRDSCTNDVIAKYAGKWTSELRTTSVLSLNKGTSPHHFSVSPSVSIYVALVDALSRELEKPNCNNETFLDDETSYGILKDTNQCLSTRLSRPPPIIIPSHKRRGRVKGKATFYEGTDTSHSSMSPNLIDVPIEIMEFNSN
ncbi:reverse transcriptase [Tanacetum coccineum]